MALNPNILLAMQPANAGVAGQSFLNSLQNMQAVMAERQRQKQQAEILEQQRLLNPLKLEMVEQQVEQGRRLEANQAGLEIHNAAKALRGITDPAQREATLKIMAPELINRFGLSQEDLADGLDDNELDAVIAKTERFAPATKPETSRVGQISPKDFTVDSIAKYGESGDIGDLVRYTPQVKDIAGIPHQYNPALSKWEPLVDMSDPRISDQAKQLADIEADKQSRLDFAKEKTNFRKKESSYISKIDSAKSKNTIMENTAAEIKSLMSGWNTKYGSSLSSLPGTEARKLKGLINTLKANSAFSTISDLKASGGTLGAISAPELTLLEAAMGTIDQGGDIEEQTRVIDQILTANMSAINRLENAYNMDKSRYSGTYDEFIRQPSSAPQADFDLEYDPATGAFK